MNKIKTAEMKFMRRVTKYTYMGYKTITKRNHTEQNLKKCKVSLIKYVDKFQRKRCLKL